MKFIFVFSGQRHIFIALHRLHLVLVQAKGGVNLVFNVSGFYDPCWENHPAYIYSFLKGRRTETNRQTVT